MTVKPEDYVNYWTSEWGYIKLPADFPIHIIRKDGWWDRRYKKDREKAQAFIEAETIKLRDLYNPIKEISQHNG